MKFLRSCAIFCSVAAAAAAVGAQVPVGTTDMLSQLASQPASRSAFTFDRSMLAMANSLMKEPTAALNSITVENYHYNGNAFYIPENMAAFNAAYDAAGYHHLVQKKVDPRETATPNGALTDLWLHNDGTNIDSVVVLVRTARQMQVIEVACELKPLDLVHLSGHFGIPKVDPGVVMVPDNNPNSRR